jgi:alpha-L-rhamnosidase
LFCPAQVEIKNPRCEYLSNPAGIDAASPRLSWIITSTQRGGKQTAYQILVATSEAALRASRGDLWDSGKVASDQTAQVLYAGKPLASGQRAWWTVRVWDAAGRPSESSAPAWWEMGLLTPDDWHGKWISPGWRRIKLPRRRSFGARLPLKAKSNAPAPMSLALAISS